MLMKQHWQGNVRELENVLVQGILYSEGDTIRRANIPIRDEGDPDNTCQELDQETGSMPYKAAKEKIWKERSVKERYVKAANQTQSGSGSHQGYINMGSFAGMGCCKNGIMQCGDQSLQGKPCREGSSGQAQGSSKAGSWSKAGSSTSASKSHGSSFTHPQCICPAGNLGSGTVLSVSVSQCVLKCYKSIIVDVQMSKNYVDEYRDYRMKYKTYKRVDLFFGITKASTAYALWQAPY